MRLVVTESERVKPEDGFTLIDHEELLKLKVPPRKWYVTSILPQGVICLYGEPKIGKSWMALQIAHSIVSGKAFMGRKVGYRGNVLYWPLEDDVTRLQDRMKAQGWQSGYKHKLHCPIDEKNRIRRASSLKEAQAILEGWIQKVQPELVIIDPLLDFAGFSDVNFYRNESVGPLMKYFIRLRDTYGCAILIIHHSRKKLSGQAEDDEGPDSMYGGRAISALSDGLIRIHGRRHARILSLSLRDGENPDISVEFDDGLWEESK